MKSITYYVISVSVAWLAATDPANTFVTTFYSLPLSLVSILITMSLPSQCADFEPYFKLSDEKLHEIVAQFRKEMEGGLAEYGQDVAMVPSFVTGVPDGSEQG
jgi:hypothetical protein